MVPRAHFGPIPVRRASRLVLMRHSCAGCASMARSIFPTSARRTISQCWVSPRLRTYLGRSPSSAGRTHRALTARRIEVRPFTPAQIKLLETFADQAVIAIENVRLFQDSGIAGAATATSEILGVIASSPTDIQPVLDAVAENAARVCGARRSNSPASKGDMLRLVAPYGTMPSRWHGARPSIALSTGRAVIDRQTSIFLIAPEVELNFPMLACQRSVSHYACDSVTA